MDTVISEDTSTTGDASGSNFKFSDRDSDKNVNERLQENILFVGNPGAGKSTLLNSLIGKIKFESGVSFIKGLTESFQIENYKGINYIDTPGLSDAMHRDRAALQITEALKKYGSYKLVFVLVLDSGRVRPDDLTTIKLVLESINDSSFPYGIVINKVTQKFKEELESNENKMIEYFTIVNCKHPPTDQLFLYPLIPNAFDENNVLLDENQKFINFLNKLRSKLVLPTNVKLIQSEKYEKENETYAKVLEEMRKNNDLMLQEYKNIIQGLQQSNAALMHTLKKRSSCGGQGICKIM